MLEGQIMGSDGGTRSCDRRCEYEDGALLPRHRFWLRALIVADTIVAESGIAKTRWK